MCICSDNGLLNLDSQGEGQPLPLLWVMFSKFSAQEITSPGWMHETSAGAWCTGKTQRDRVEREVGGGIGMGNTCISKADSCQCMTKNTTIL